MRSWLSSRSFLAWSTARATRVWQRLNQLLALHVPSRISARAEIPVEAVGHFLLCNGFLRERRLRRDLASQFRNPDVRCAVFHSALCDLWHSCAGFYAQHAAVGAKTRLSGELDRYLRQSQYSGDLHWLWPDSMVLSGIADNSIIAICVASLLFLTSSNEHLAFKLILRSAAALTCLFALLLTGSRAGLICTCFGLMVAIMLMVANRRKARFWLSRFQELRLLRSLSSGSVVDGWAVTGCWTRRDGRSMSFALRPSGSDLFWVPELAALQICFHRSGPTTSPAGASGTMLTPQF